MFVYLVGIITATIIIKRFFDSKEPREPSFGEYSKPSFGEYRCSCGRYWFSHLSWDNCYQECKQCHGRVYPSKLRPVLASDKAKEKGPEHPREMCQMCQQLGQYCGNYRQDQSMGRPIGPRKGSESDIFSQMKAIWKGN